MNNERRLLAYLEELGDGFDGDLAQSIGRQIARAGGVGDQLRDHLLERTSLDMLTAIDESARKDNDMPGPTRDILIEKLHNLGYLPLGIPVPTDRNRIQNYNAEVTHIVGEKIAVRLGLLWRGYSVESYGPDSTVEECAGAIVEDVGDSIDSIPLIISEAFRLYSESPVHVWDIFDKPDSGEGELRWYALRLLDDGKTPVGMIHIGVAALDFCGLHREADSLYAELENYSHLPRVFSFTVFTDFSPLEFIPETWMFDSCYMERGAIHLGSNSGQHNHRHVTVIRKDGLPFTRPEIEYFTDSCEAGMEHAVFEGDEEEDDDGY